MPLWGDIKNALRNWAPIITGDEYGSGATAIETLKYCICLRSRGIDGRKREGRALPKTRRLHMQEDETE